MGDLVNKNLLINSNVVWRGEQYPEYYGEAY